MVAKPQDVDGARETERFARLDFDAFRKLATDQFLSEHEKIGFPDGFRKGFDEVIWADFLGKSAAESKGLSHSGHWSRLRTAPQTTY